MTAEKQDLLFHVGHRDRLRQKFLDCQLSEGEVLELLLADVIPRRDVRPLARGLIKHFGDMTAVLTAPLSELMAFKGIGKNTAIHLKLVNHIMVNGYKAKLKDTPVYRDQKVLDNYCIGIFAGKEIEEFHILFLDGDYHMLKDHVHSIGTFDWTPIFEREILKHALLLNAAHVVMVHNHPTSTKKFSVEDVYMTNLIKELLQKIDVNLYDHYVVTSGGVLYSARNELVLK